jgi:antiviral defense system Shedu protein SduA
LATLGMGLSPSEANPASPLTGDRRSPLIRVLDSAWMTVVFAFVAPAPIVLLQPGRCTIFHELPDGSERNVGVFYCGTIDPEPLSSERIAAIKSDPRAAKAVRLRLSCTKCDEGIGAYAALERNATAETDGYTWHQDLPDSYICACGENQFDLRQMRKNLFGLIGVNRAENEAVTYVPLYEKSTLNNLRVEFVNLLQTASKEEQLQKFIENNPILLRQFPAQRILFKPALLTRYIADFAILSPQRELILIEIEPASMSLLRKNGDHAAPLTHAVNQVQNWLQIVDDHRLACLTEMNIEPSFVGNIRGVVIGGRDTGYDPANLRQLKSVFSGRISVLTYDDLLGSLSTLIDQIDRL